MKIEERVIKIIAKAIEVESNKIDEDTAIGDFPNWDSMGQLIIITSLEKEFDIKFDPWQTQENAITIQEILDKSLSTILKTRVYK